MTSLRNASAALVSLLVISLVTLIIVIAFSENSISTLEIQYHSQEASRSYYIAESCLEEAITRLESDLNFDSSAITFDSNQSCSISVTGMNPKIILITTTVDDLIERYQAEASYDVEGTINNFSLSSWAELP